MQYLPFSAISEKSFGDPEITSLHRSLRQADHDFRRAKAVREDYETLRELCETYIKVSYAYQKARWGKVRVRFSTAGLMR